MKWEDFYKLLIYQDPFLIGGIFILILSFLFLLYKKNIFYIFDPLNLMILNLSSCLTVIIYLVLKKKIYLYSFFQLFAINITFIFSFKFFLKLKKRRLIFSHLKDKKFFKIFFILHSIIFYSILFIYLKEIGLQALKNKMTVFSGMGGLRYISLIIFPGQLILIILKREMYKKKNKLDFLILGIILFLFLTSGGRIAIVFYIFYFNYIYFILYKIKISQKFLKFFKHQKKMIFISALGIILLFGITQNVGIHELDVIMKKIYFRIMSSGDIYYMAYPSKIIDKIKNITIKEYYLNSIFIPILRRFGYEMKIYGYEIIKYLYSIEKPYMGPNNRFDVLLQSNIGFFGIFISIITAYIIAFFRQVRTSNFILIYIIGILFVNSESMVTDFTLFANFIIGLFLVIPIVYVSSLFLLNTLMIKNNYMKKLN